MKLDNKNMIETYKLFKVNFLDIIIHICISFSVAANKKAGRASQTRL